MSPAGIAELWRTSPHSYRRFAGGTLLFFCVMAADISLFPPLYSLQVAIAAAFFTITVTRKRHLFEGIRLDEHRALRGAALFFAAQSLVVAVGCKWMPRDAMHGAIVGFAAPALRLLVPLSGLLLFSIGDWRKIAATFRAEAVASLVVLFNIFPYRAADYVWNHGASQLLNKAVYALLVPLFHDAYLSPGSESLVGTARFPARLVIGCSGINEVFLFQEVFLVFLLLEWKRLIPARALRVYALGIAAMLVTNVFRLVLIVSAGTLWHDAAETAHANAGWSLFIPVIAVLLWRTYPWILGLDRFSRVHPCTPRHVSEPALTA